MTPAHRNEGSERHKTDPIGTDGIEPGWEESFRVGPTCDTSKETKKTPYL